MKWTDKPTEPGYYWVSYLNKGMEIRYVSQTMWGPRLDDHTLCDQPLMVFGPIPFPYEDKPYEYENLFKRMISYDKGPKQIIMIFDAFWAGARAGAIEEDRWVDEDDGDFRKAVLPYLEKFIKENGLE